MTISYKGDKPTEDGIYLVRLTDLNAYPNTPELHIAEYDDSLEYWQQTGIDYDVWTHGGRYEIEVIAKLDLPLMAAQYQPPSQAKFTKDELTALFGDSMPLVLAKLLFPELGAELTIGDFREIARALALQSKTNEIPLKAMIARDCYVTHARPIDPPWEQLPPEKQKLWIDRVTVGVTITDEMMQ